MPNVDFLEKGLGIVSPPHFVYGFSRKMFLMLCYIDWSNLILSFPLLIAFTLLIAFDIDQYVSCNYLLLRLWRHKIWN